MQRFTDLRQITEPGLCFVQRRLRRLRICRGEFCDCLPFGNDVFRFIVFFGLLEVFAHLGEYRAGNGEAIFCLRNGTPTR